MFSSQDTDCCTQPLCPPPASTPRLHLTPTLADIRAGYLASISPSTKRVLYLFGLANLPTFFFRTRYLMIKWLYCNGVSQAVFELFEAG